MERKHRALLLALPTVLTLLFFFVAPMVYILVHTLHENGFSDFVDFFGDPFYRNILWVTLRVSLVSTAISLVLGYPTAFYMARTKSRMKQVMMIVILFPFLVSAVVGALFEYVCSWVQEMAFGTVSWEYSNEPLNLNGRTSLSFAVMWGVLGLVFMKHVLPFLERHIERLPVKAGTIITWILIVLMVLDIVISAAAVRRQTDRHNGVPSTNIITEFLDNHYPDSFLKLIYPNMEQPGRG